MNKLDEIILKTRARADIGEEYWLGVQKEIDDFFSGDHPQSEKDKLVLEGRLDSVFMLCPSLHPKKHS